MIGLIFILFALSLALVGIIHFVRQRNVIWRTLSIWVNEMARIRSHLQRRNFRQLWYKQVIFRRSNYLSKTKQTRSRPFSNSELLPLLLLPILALIPLFLVIVTTLPDSVLADQIDRSNHDTSNSEFEDSLIPGLVANAITGAVYRDFDSDGTRDALEPGVPNIIVTAYLPSGAVIPATTDANGVYTINGIPTGVRARLEVTGLPSYLQPGPAGADSETTVTFATENDTNVDVGLVNPSQYCQTNPDIATACYVNGDPLLGGNAGSQDVLVTFPHDTASGTTPGPTHEASGNEIGTTWGLAYQRQNQTLFAATLLRRHAGFGPNPGPGRPTGVIYQLDMSGVNPPAPFVNLDGLGGIDTGNEPANRNLPADMNIPNNDPNAWDAVGKTAFGDMDVSSDEESLWVMSLNDQTLYKVDIGAPPTVPTAGDITGFPLTTLPAGATACPATSDIRPWAVQVHDGLVYVGVVCSAESTQSVNDLRAYILSLDPANPGAGFSLVFQFPLNFRRGAAVFDVFSAPPGNETYPSDWHPWVMQMTTVFTHVAGNPTQGILAFDRAAIYPQPILSDIEFDENGSLILGFIDRAGLQTGSRNFSTTVGSPLTSPLVTGITTPPPFPADGFFEGVMAGDMVRICKLANGTFELENNGTCGGITTGGAGNNEGPGGGEFYYQDNFQNLHREISMGGLALLPGGGQVASILYDPFSVRSAGVGWFDNTGPSVGQRTRSYEIFGTDALPPGNPGEIPATFGKSAGLGDLQLICNAAPIEIGNRIWNDDDGDGIQDADEGPIVGVIVGLYDSVGNLLITTTTNAQGQYAFNDANVPGNLQYNTDYQVRIEPSNFNTGQALEGFRPSPSDADGSTNGDARDSDGIDLGGGITGVNITTGGPGVNNHSYDLGFILDADIGVMISATPAIPGQTITYTIVVTLDGTILTPLTGITLTANLPGGVQNPIFIPSVGTYNPNTGTWSGLSMTPGGQIILTVVGTIPSDFSGTLQTTVTINGDGLVDSLGTNNLAQNTQFIPPTSGSGGSSDNDDDDDDGGSSSSSSENIAAPTPTVVPTQPALPVLLLPETGVRETRLEALGGLIILFALLGVGTRAFYLWRRSNKDNSQKF